MSYKLHTNINLISPILCEIKIVNLITRREQIFAVYSSFTNKNTASDILIAVKYLKQLLAMDEDFEKVDKEKILLEKANTEFQATVGEAATTQMRIYVSKQK